MTDSGGPPLLPKETSLPPDDPHTGREARLMEIAHHRAVRLIVEALRARGRDLGDLTWNPEEPADFVQREFGGDV